MKTARVPAGPILSTADIVAEEQYQLFVLEWPTMPLRAQVLHPLPSNLML